MKLVKFATAAVLVMGVQSAMAARTDTAETNTRKVGPASNCLATHLETLDVSKYVKAAQAQAVVNGAAKGTEKDPAKTNR